MSDEEREAKVRQLLRDIEPKLDELIKVYYRDGEDAVLVDAAILVASTRIDDEGHTCTSVIGLPVNEDMPDYRFKGLLVDVRDMTLLSTPETQEPS